MKTFIQEIAQRIQREYPDWDRLTVIFPNRRAALYFRKALASELPSPRWAPAILSIEEFIGQFSELKEAEKLSLVMRLYQVFKQVANAHETLDHFYFWGEMLLRDFDELDKYLVPAAGLFKDLSNQKELDQYFDYLTEEQKQFLREFWQTLEFSTSESKKRFLELWQNLFPVYTAFRESLAEERIGYGGMIHRAVAENIDNIVAGLQQQQPNHQYVFAGFNALTSAEEKILTAFVQKFGAKIMWDEDAYYVNENHREAGTFFRQYRKHEVLSHTFDAAPASHLGGDKDITLIGVPQKAGQPKLLGQQLQEAIRAKSNVEAERTVIVLPDENLLFPVLYALPASLPTVNVTMGFPLVSTPYYLLIDYLFELHQHRRTEDFYYRYVLALLNHPYIQIRIGEDGLLWRDQIVRDNQVYIAQSYFGNKYPLLDMVFTDVDSKDFLPYLMRVIEEVATTSSGSEVMEQEFAFHFHRILARVHDIALSEPMDLRMQQRMFRQIVRSEKVPFSGEPLQGLQIMGVLETRNLDFDHVIVLSLNEGLWPAAPKQSSYIPHNIRRAYQLPTSEHQDAMYAYLFYRLLQRAKKIDLYYNTEPDVLGTGEMSRYLYQLIYESRWPHQKKILYNPVQIHEARPIIIEKKTDVLVKMERYFGKALSPSALNTYLECRLKFYFRNLIEIQETKEVEEDADARIFGNILHKVMEFFYIDLRSPAGVWRIEERDFANLSSKLDYLIERAFRHHFKLLPEKKFEYNGMQLVVKEMVKEFAMNVLKHDKAEAPFTIEMLENKNFSTPIKLNQPDRPDQVILGGLVDRIDQKGNTIRIIDYKTGKDENSFPSVASLFERGIKRNKAAFQAMLYAWVYVQNNKHRLNEISVQPGLINRKEIFKDDFAYGLYLGDHRLKDVQSLLPEFEQLLRALLVELFDPTQSFDQTDDLNICKYCDYREICSR